MPGDAAFGLTDLQRETLVLAAESGYYDVPKEATLDDLSTVLDVSRQAVSARLNRGVKQLVEATLVD